VVADARGTACPCSTIRNGDELSGPQAERVQTGHYYGVVTYENEDCMPATSARYRILATVVVLSLGLVLSGCSGNAGDSGAKRSDQQSKQLRDRVTTTQIDR